MCFKPLGLQVKDWYSKMEKHLILKENNKVDKDV